MRCIWADPIRRREKKQKAGIPPQENDKECICWGLLVLILGLAAWNLIRYPLRGNTYDVLGINREEITEVKIFHYGRTLHVADEERLGILLSLFDCSLERDTISYLCCSSSADWAISFVTQDGNTSRWVEFYPSYGRNGSSPERLCIDRYYYSCDKAIDEEIPIVYWEAEFKKDFE